MTARICRTCGERPVSPSRLRTRDYRCSRCVHNTPLARARTARYHQSAKRRAVMARDNAKRIYIGQRYHSRVDADDARRINAHIKERRREFVTRQSDGKEAQGATPR